MYQNKTDTYAMGMEAVGPKVTDILDTVEEIEKWQWIQMWERSWSISI